jgi:amidohydrolase
VDAVFGMHNWPELPVKGRVAHAAMPHLAVDPIAAAAQVVNGLQTIVSRNTHPLEGSVVSVTQIHGGDTWNVIPETVVLRGTTRSFTPAVRDQIELAIQRVAEGTCRAAGAEMRLRYEHRYPATIKSRRETELAATAAASLVGDDNVKRDLLPSMAAEDFAWFLEKKLAPISGSATAVTITAECCTARTTTSMTRYCRWVPAIGCGSPNRYYQRIMPRPNNPDLRSSYPDDSGVVVSA